MDRIGIVQLSDLQFGKKHTFGYPSIISQKLYYDISTVAEKYSFDIAYIVITGDISETAHKEEFDDAYKQIESLRSKLSIDKAAIHTIPGNHDINWELCKIADKVGDPNIKYSLYKNFDQNLTGRPNSCCDNEYLLISDNRNGIDFLHINSCEKETHIFHEGYIDEDKLLRAVQKLPKEYIHIVLIHHRIDTASTDPHSRVPNGSSIESILACNGINIVLTGHMHQGISQCITKDGKTIIYSGCGSSGVNKEQRVDGIQNQYSIHVIDRLNKSIETHWRSYNPSSKNKFGLGGWTPDNGCSSNPEIFGAPFIINHEMEMASYAFDYQLIKKYNLTSNPFTFTNAEKISSNDLVLELFVSDESRHKSATRLIGDAIIRGPRGSGKTMLLRYLNIIGNIEFRNAIREGSRAQALPVLINLSKIHRSEWQSGIDSIVKSADKLIYDSVIDELQKKAHELQLPSYNSSLFRLKQRLQILENQDSSLISKLGDAVQNSMSTFFSHILLLIDEIAPVFPKEFFSKADTGFLKWMNDIRNSGPFFTRVAVYPNDISDILNEERFGSIVNLDFDIKKDEDYIAFRKYIITTVNKYLKSVSINKDDPIKIDGIITVLEDNVSDSLEQLIYASDGSSRRFLTLMDKCVNSDKNGILSKDDVLEIIKDYSTNLLTSYDKSDQEIALSIAKACKTAATYRFQMPGFSTILYNLHSGHEELNIIKIAELGTGQRATIYEFTYPYCILMEVHTHNIKETRRICSTRDRVSGKWISSITKIKRKDLDYFNSINRSTGYVTDIDEDVCIIKTNEGQQFLGNIDNNTDICLNCEVAFSISDQNAIDLEIIHNSKTK
jgi:hypothetical protein